MPSDLDVTGDRLDTRTSEWYLATRLGERLTAHGEPPTEPGDDGVSDELVALRDTFPYSEDETFAAVLRGHGLTPEGFARLFRETADEVCGRFTRPPVWLSRLDGFPWGSDPGASAASRTLGVWSPEADPERQRIGQLLGFVRPLVDRGVETMATGVRAVVRAFGAPVDADRLCALLACTWPRRAMTRLVLRVLILELNIARLRGRLPGADGAERFAAFASWLSDPGRALTIWRTYPTLLRECGALVDAWVTARLEFCEHLCADWDAIGRGDLADISFDVGDSHRGGRSVGIVTFQGGEKIVYKPRSLRVDEHFQTLLAWANDEGFEPGFPTLELVCRDDHGWSEFVTPSACSDTGQVERFYRRHGGYLALAHALRATDLHFENVIAAGEYPYLVDLEALFGAELRRSEGAADEVTSRLVMSTVLATGLLPNPVVRLGDADQVPTDLSGISYRPGQLTPGQVPTWADPATDTMRIVHRRMRTGESRNAPNMAGETVRPADHVEDIVAGFTSMYRMVEGRKSALAGPGGLLERFRDDSVRRVLEATETYSSFLWDSYHPNLLRNAVDRDQYLDRTFARFGSHHAGAAVAASERRQLADGDVPLFTSSVDGRGLLGGDGTVIDDALETTGLRAVRERVLGFSPTDMRHQQWVIRSAFACTAVESLDASWPVHTVTGAAHAVSRESLVARARRIGDTLVTTAVRTADDIGWLGISPSGPLAWRLAPTSSGMYSGVAGIAFFLLHLGLVTGAASYTETAADVARSLARRARRLRHLPAPPAGVPALGLTGEVDCGMYFAAHWAAATGDFDLLAELTADVVPRLDRAVVDAAEPDLVDGLAGVLLGLSAAQAVLPSDSVADLATRCADALVRAGRPQDAGVGWNSQVAGDRPLCGMAHGASGVALALSRWSAVMGTSRYDETVQDAFRYEGSLLAPGVPGWPDLRPGAAEGTTMTAWCHGAPGIGIARSVPAARGEHPTAVAALADLGIALDATAAPYADRSAITVRNLSLCHGELGNLEFLLTASHSLDNGRGRALAERLIHAICVTLDEHGPICGVPEGLSTPGLMTGVAGIGYGLLRLAEPERTPVVLSFEPPRLRRRWPG
ncbi:type 2 lanthipeptide synthetase LanM family protein [Streptomyces asiaticus]